MKEITMEHLLSVINENQKFQVNDSMVDTDLTELGMDSIEFIQLIVRVEDTFGYEIPDSKLLIAELNTATKILDVLNSLSKQQ